MDTDCTLITKEGPIVTGVSSGDFIDFIRFKDSQLQERKGFMIGHLPESVCGKCLPIYVESEDIYQQIRKGWEK